MSRWFAALALISLIGVDRAQAQTRESAPGPGTFEVTIIPGGATFFTEASDSNSPSFGNYDLGGSATVNFNRFVGVEGEVSGLLGVSQSLDFVDRHGRCEDATLSELQRQPDRLGRPRIGRAVCDRRSRRLEPVRACRGRRQRHRPRFSPPMSVAA